MTTSAQQNNQQPPNGSSASVPDLNSAGMRIAVIHADSFYEPNNGIGRLVNAIKTLDQEFQGRKTELQSMQQRIEQLTNETGGTAPVLPPATARLKLDQLEQLKKDLQRKAEDAQAEYSKRLRETLSPILEDLDKAIKSFAQQRGIALILDSSQLEDGILYMSESLDLTRTFIVEFNRANPIAPVSSPR